MVNERPNTILAKATHNIQIQKLLIGSAKNSTPINIDKFLNSLKKCQASVKPTSKVIEKGNLAPCFGSPFLYLFFQDTSGSQNNCFLKLKKMEVV